MARRPDSAKPSFLIGDSIADILAEAGIALGRAQLRAGVDVKVMCPACGGGSIREKSLSVKLDDDGRGVAWHCFRGNCVGSREIPGNGKIGEAGPRDEAPRRRERPAPIKPKLDAPEEQGRPPSMYGWFEKRGISPETVDSFGIYGRLHRFPIKDQWVEKPALVFPYRWRGEVVNRKYRSLDKEFMQDGGALRTLFNADAIEAPDEVIFVEGEMDVLACWEAGLRQVVSIPDGSPSKRLEEDDPKRGDDKRFDALEECADALKDVKRIVIATDDDTPGGYLAEEFARRLGRLRCWRVTWPEGSKDSNDVLLKHGVDALQKCIAEAQPWPLEGIVNIRPGQLSHFLRSGMGPRGLESGITAFDEIARLPAGPGWLTVVTGLPSHGKTSVVRPWITYLAQKHDLGVVWCSPEDNQAETVALEVARIIAGQPLQEAGTYIPDSILSKAEEWISKRITFLQSNNPDVEMSLEWVLKRAEEAKRRHPRQLLLLDPFNEFEHQMGRNESETQYIGRWLRRLKAWGRAEGMSVLIVAHPKTQIKDPKTKRYPVVDGYDINGGANWNNKADLGLTVYRAEEGYVEAHCWKARFKPFGKRNGQARMKLDPRSGRLSSPVVDDQASMMDGDDE